MNPLKYVVSAVVATLLCAGVAVAQEVVEGLDYRDFKFYKEDAEDDISLWGGLDEQQEEQSAVIYQSSNSRYALSYGLRGRRGMPSGEARTIFGFMPVDYTTMRTLSSLGYKASVESGMSGAVLTGAMGETSALLLGAESRLYERQSLRVDLSGRNYLVGVNYRGVYDVAPLGVPLKEGWVVMTNARVRTGRDIYVEGVYTNAVDMAVAASYEGRNDNVELIIALPWSERGLRQASTEEAFTLTHNRLYNPAWGLQGGKVRNSRVATSLRPEAVALWRRRLSAVTDMTLATNIYFERRGSSALTWFNAPTPAPDNYKYMPSYFAREDEHRVVEDAWVANDLRYTQIDWDRLYHTNALQSDGHARYAVASRRANVSHATVNMGFKSRVKDADLEYGVAFGNDSEREFRVIDDLLGAQYIVDRDYYLEDDATYSHLTDNNLRKPDNVVGEGGRYGYDYRLARLAAMLYATARWRLWGVDFALGANMAVEHTHRRGYFEKELFAGAASYGRSKGVTMLPAMLTAKGCYSLGNHGFGVVLMVRGESPNVEDMFLQTEYNNRCVESPELATSVAAEMSYGYTAQRVRLGARLYVAAVTREMDVLHYYDDLAGEYVDAVVRGIGHLHYGVELSADVSWSQYFSSNFALNAAQYIYHRNPVVVTYSDDDNSLIANSISEVKGCRVGAPQISAYGDVAFRYRGWMARASAQYWGARYASVSFVRRTVRVVSYAASPEEALALKNQQRLPDAATIDVAVSKRIKFNDALSLNIQLSVRNLLGSSVVYSAYEENRVSHYKVGNRTYIAPFANRMMYAYPYLFSLSASLWF